MNGFNAKMEEEKIKSGLAHGAKKVAGGKPMILEPEQVIESRRC